MSPEVTAIPSSTHSAIDAFIQDPRDEALDALLQLEGARSTDLLARFAASPQFTEALFRRLLASGCVVNTSGPIRDTALGAIIGEGSLGASARRALCEDLLARGADPNLSSGHRAFTACDWAVMRSTEQDDWIAMFLPLATPTSRFNMLLTAIAMVPTHRDYADGHALVDRLLGVVDDVDQSGRMGLTAVHMAAIEADVPTLDRVLRREKTPGRGLPAKVDIVVDGVTVSAKKGLNALSLADALSAAYAKAAPKMKKMPPFVQALRAKRIEHLTACRKRLTEAGLE